MYIVYCINGNSDLKAFIGGVQGDQIEKNFATWVIFF
jgi:hypothetical protein